MKLFYLLLCTFFALMPQVIAAQADESGHFLMSKEDTILLAWWLRVPINTQSLKSCSDYAIPQAADDCIKEQSQKLKIEYDKKEQLTIFFARHGNHEAADMLLEWLEVERPTSLAQKVHYYLTGENKIFLMLYGLIAEEDSVAKAVQSFANTDGYYSASVSAALTAVLLGRDKQRFEQLTDQMMLFGQSKKRICMNLDPSLSRQYEIQRGFYLSNFVEASLAQFSEYQHYPFLRQRFIDLNQKEIDYLGLTYWFEQELRKRDESHNQYKQQEEKNNFMLHNDLLMSVAKSRDNSWPVREGVFDTLGIEDIGKATETKP